MKHKSILINKFDEKKLKDFFYKLNNYNKLPECIIADDYSFDNKFLHFEKIDEKSVSFFILNTDFLKFYLAFILEILTYNNTTAVCGIRINNVCLTKTLNESLFDEFQNLFSKEIEQFKKNTPAKLTVTLSFP
jgi:hypothetical protein